MYILYFIYASDICVIIVICLRGSFINKPSDKIRVNLYISSYSFLRVYARIKLAKLNKHVRFINIGGGGGKEGDRKIE